MDRRKELIRAFVKEQLKALTAEKSVPKELLKKSKVRFFVELHRNEVGVPKDREIAYEAVDYLLHIGYIKNPAGLSDLLSLPFFNSQVSDSSIFIEKLSVDSSRGVIDFKRLREAEYEKDLKDEIRRQIILNETEEIEEAKKAKIAEYESLPSVLDGESFEEPPEAVEPTGEEKYLPWWKRLKLKEDPFPIQEGLQKIPEDLVDRVVTKTDVFGKYAYRIQNDPRGLFKDTLFFGQFGSGKTTLFNYLGKPLINQGVYPLMIQLLPEKDLYGFLTRFKREFRDELQRLYEKLSSSRLLPEGSDLDENIIAAIRRTITDYSPKGFVVFVDDLHKLTDPEEFATVLKFLSSLQIFKASLSRSIPGLEIAFYVSALPEWSQVISNDEKYRGSFPMRENMPPITVDVAHEMLNRRLEAYSAGPESMPVGGGISVAYVEKIYRGLEYAHSDITFRSFIYSVITEFEKGNFSILQADPVHIPDQVLADIRSRLDGDVDLKSRMHNLVFGGGIQKEEARARCLEVLVECYLKNGFMESASYFKENPFYFQRLARARLIEKVRVGSSFKWMACVPLLQQNKRIETDCKLSLPDYLLKAFKSTSSPKPKKPAFHQELADIESMLSKVALERRPHLERARDTHRTLLEVIDRYDAAVAPSEILNMCMNSLCDVTNTIMYQLGASTECNSARGLQEAWSGSWCQAADDVIEFTKSARDVHSSKDYIWYVCKRYREAFYSLLSQLSEELDMGTQVPIPVTDLSSSEIKEFHDIRHLWAKREYYTLVEKLSKQNEKKLRAFLINIFRLRYGEDSRSRIAHLDKESANYIRQNVEKYVSKNLPVGDNEFEQLNRGNYKSFMIGTYNKHEGARNWSNFFSTIFAPWTETELRDFLSVFADFNIETSHLKEGSVSAGQQSRIYSYMVHSIDFVRAMNRSYWRIVSEGVSVMDTHASPRYAHLFDYFSDTEEKQPVFVTQEEAERISGYMRPDIPIVIDLSDHDFIQTYYKLPYRQCMAFLSRINGHTILHTDGLRYKAVLRPHNGSCVKLTLEKMN